METVLDLYQEPPDPACPLVCFDETSKQLIKETRLPLSIEPGRPERFDSEYARNGVANLFLFLAPQLGWRHVEVTERRTGQDFAQQMKALVEVHFPQAQRVRVVLDNLNTHTPASLYEAFAPAEALRILRKLEFIYTPKHGSWLNMAELEFSVLSRQCLDRRIPDMDALRRETAAWEAARNAAKAGVTWRFTVEDARTKMERLYPS